ncbi:hypothetical protein [Rathayibacter toxicus]|uniref:PH domain-containing protein n=1 Tax=Rathayibacter toxicus TaxID=145458 RepID=A0A2S5Y7P6_9MICO|nr:hypothetical protein [Rathayibacter toxicus]ALS58058.1 hypothetical protein APU90_10020 [Rathayibacter toxicus]PPG21910.1 hypothetical protein C5D15_06885 [Rathayibacter toxicus]PPG46872.1 hypothetical protein C5D16_06860 [Rathayibacter toxicus]PPH23945.1 hypothetical protein C5D17_06860 [Rathayibacter toxicus]PPH57753.1 hypothetical protein C5D30_06870 [Rathayibacter toxicus]
MDRAAITIGIAAVIVLVFVGMAISWRARRRRGADLASEPGSLASLGAELESVEAPYVATTRFEQPLERVVLPGLGFRGRATLRLHERGVVIAPVGERETAIPAQRLHGAGRGSYVIDRAVEEGGLLVISWSPRGTEMVDSYLRVGDPRLATHLVAELLRLADPEFSPSDPGSADGGPAPTQKGF